MNTQGMGFIVKGVVQADTWYVVHQVHKTWRFMQTQDMGYIQWSFEYLVQTQSIIRTAWNVKTRYEIVTNAGYGIETMRYIRAGNGNLDIV